MCFIIKLKTLLQNRIGTKKDTLRIRIQSITMIKTIYGFQHSQKNRSRNK